MLLTEFILYLPTSLSSLSSDMASGSGSGTLGSGFTSSLVGSLDENPNVAIIAQ